MNFKGLQPFIEKLAASDNPKIKEAANALLDQVIDAQQIEEVEQPTLHAQEQGEPLHDRPKDEIDRKIDNWMPDITKPDQPASTFGKAASLYDAYSTRLKTKPTLFTKYSKKK